MPPSRKAEIRRIILETTEKGALTARRRAGTGAVLTWSRPRPAAVVTAVVLSGLIFAAVGVAVGLDLLEREDRTDALRERIAGEPKRLGERVVVASGPGWSLMAYVSNRGLCLDVATSEGSTGGCGFAVRGSPTAGDTSRLIAGQKGVTRLGAYVTGVASPEVTRVAVGLTSEQLIEARVLPAPSDLGVEVSFFVVRIASKMAGFGGADIRSLHAYDAQGNEIDRRTF